MSDRDEPATFDSVPLFPLPNTVLFPRAVLPLHIFEERYKTMTADALRGRRQIAMALLRPGWEKSYYGAPEIEPIVCVGETFEERETGRAAAVLERQFTNGFRGLTSPDFSRIIIAYEPVWAIGTGRTATPEMAAESHAKLRSLAREGFGSENAEGLRILYGGSVKPENIRGLMAQPEIDGALVGGASLMAESFAAIVHYR